VSESRSACWHNDFYLKVDEALLNNAKMAFLTITREDRAGATSERVWSLIFCNDCLFEFYGVITTGTRSTGDGQGVKLGKKSWKFFKFKIIKIFAINSQETNDHLHFNPLSPQQ
jgi:hypothetical protein